MTKGTNPIWFVPLAFGRNRDQSTATITLEALMTA